MTPPDGEVTPAILLQHMQAMEGRIMEKFDQLEQKVDRNHVILSTQITNLDERLDDLEVVQVPKLKKAVGMR